jgi:hypothetical protein
VSAGKPSGAGERWDGYSKSENVTGEDGQPVSSKFAQCWPPGTPGIGAAGRGPGAQQVPSRSLIHPGGDQGKKKRPAKPVAGGGKPKARKAKKAK